MAIKRKVVPPYEVIGNIVRLKIDGREVSLPDLIKDTSLRPELRSEGDLKGIGYYLDDDFNWKIVRDEDGINVLIPYSEDEL